MGPRSAPSDQNRCLYLPDDHHRMPVKGKNNWSKVKQPGLAARKLLNLPETGHSHLLCVGSRAQQAVVEEDKI